VSDNGFIVLPFGNQGPLVTDRERFIRYDAYSWIIGNIAKTFTEMGTNCELSLKTCDPRQLHGRPRKGAKLASAGERGPLQQGNQKT
jgi:hypothetical protein